MMRLSFEIDPDNLVADGRGWSRQEQITVVGRGTKEVSKRKLDITIFQGGVLLRVLHLIGTVVDESSSSERRMVIGDYRTIWADQFDMDVGLEEIPLDRVVASVGQSPI